MSDLDTKQETVNSEMDLNSNETKRLSVKRENTSNDNKAKEDKLSTKYYAPDGTERHFIHARDRKLALDHDVGKIKVITDASKESEGGGFWCDVCKCSLKDNKAWLDHINGKKHQHRLGNVVRVRKVTVDEVKEKFKSLKHESSKVSARDIYLKQREERLKKQKEEEEKAKKEKEEKEGDNPYLKEVLGFGGFGSTKKK